MESLHPFGRFYLWFGCAITKNLQAAYRRNAYRFSMELCAASVLILSASLTAVARHRRTRLLICGHRRHLFHCHQQCGRYIVGWWPNTRVTVWKGFALILVFSCPVVPLTQPEQVPGTNHGWRASGYQSLSDKLPSTFDSRCQAGLTGDCDFVKDNNGNTRYCA
jgi:hypothetical protein